MRLAARLVILALIAGVLLNGCAGRTAENGNSGGKAGPASNAPKTSVEDLGLLIHLPYEVEDCLWKQDPGSQAITAVLRFDEEDTGKLKLDVEKLRPAEEASIGSQTWFPSDMVVESDVRGDDRLQGKSYAADPFFQEPFTSGRLVRIEGTDYWVLELAAR